MIKKVISFSKSKYYGKPLFPDLGVSSTIYYKDKPIKGNETRVLNDMKETYTSLGLEDRACKKFVSTLYNQSTELVMSSIETTPELGVEIDNMSLTRLYELAGIEGQGNYQTYIEQCINSNYSPMLEIKGENDSDGYGVFVMAQAIKEGQFIGTFSGELRDSYEDSAYNIALQSITSPLNRESEKVITIEPISIGNHTRFINSDIFGCNSNVEPIKVAYRGVVVCCLVATKDISKDEELLADYGIYNRIAVAQGIQPGNKMYNESKLHAGDLLLEMANETNKGTPNLELVKLAKDSYKKVNKDNDYYYSVSQVCTIACIMTGLIQISPEGIEKGDIIAALSRIKEVENIIKSISEETQEKHPEIKQVLQDRTNSIKDARSMLGDLMKQLRLTQ